MSDLSSCWREIVSSEARTYTDLKDSKDTKDIKDGEAAISAASFVS
jgi:hypothetical protein